MMKNILMIGLLTLSSISLSAQQLSTKDGEAIDGKVADFLKLIEQKRYTQVLDFMYPPIFEHTSKNEVFQIFSMLEASGIELDFKNLQVSNKQALSSDNKSKYVMIQYNFEMELPLTTDDLKGIAPLIVPMLEGNFGKGNVEYNKSKNYINVKGDKYLMGINDPEYKDWLFLIYDASFKTAIEKVIPAKVNQQAAALAY